MITHTVSWYESEDGQIFADDMECLAHDVNVLYKRSGVRFFIGKEEIENLIIEDDQSYNEMTDIFIDRSKEEENARFKESVQYDLGWCLVDEALEGTGSHYRFIPAQCGICDDVIEVKEGRQ